MNYYDFTERRRWSEGFCSEGIEPILMARMPNATAVSKASESADKQGTDYWVERDNGLPALSVDIKARDHDYKKSRGRDDLALETYSVCNTKVGWTRDQNKRTDYVLWYWRDTGRFLLVPFPPLCQVFERYWREWRETYGHWRQTSGGWQSECVFVPRDVVFMALLEWMGEPLTEAELAKSGSGLLEKVRGGWANVLQQIDNVDRKIGALLRDCRGVEGLEGNTLVLTFAYDFHRNQIAQPENRTVVETAISAFVGRPLAIVCKIAQN